MRQLRVPVVGLLLVASSGGAFADGPPPPPTPAERVVPAGDGLLEYGQHTVIGANMFGAIQEINVREGEHVKAGQVLGRLRDDDLRADLAVAEAEAENPFPIRLAEATYRQNQIASEVNSKVMARNTGLVSTLEINQQHQATEAARWQLEQAKFNQRLLKLKRDAVAAQVSLKAFICPHDGVVIEIFKKPAESASFVDPVMRVVNTDFFRVSGSVELKEAWRVRAGQEVRVAPLASGADLPIRGQTFSGELVFVDRAIDPKDQTCRVIAEVKNRDDLLRAGLRVRMEILPDHGRGPGPAAGAPAANKPGP